MGSQRAGSCIGDSGGGFFVDKGMFWMLQGVASPSVVTKECIDDTFATYSNIKYFAFWIKNVVERGTATMQAITLTNFYIFDTYDKIRR